MYHLKDFHTSVGWCHVVCALFIPEAWFANVQTMEPIMLKNVPPDRFGKVCVSFIPLPTVLHISLNMFNLRLANYAKVYIIFVFLFANLFVIPSLFVELLQSFTLKVSQVVYISPTTHHKAFLFGP